VLSTSTSTSLPSMSGSRRGRLR